MDFKKIIGHEDIISRFMSSIELDRVNHAYIIAGEEGLCIGCGVATLSISYYDLGVTTGKMAAKILKGEADIATMPVEYYPNPVKEYNPEFAADFNIEFPEDYIAIEVEG